MFNESFKTVLHWKQQSCPAPLIHSRSHAPIFVYQHICLLICSLRSCTTAFCWKTAQKKKKRWFSRQITFPIWFPVQLHKHHSAPTTEQPRFWWQLQLTGWAGLHPTEYSGYSANGTTGHPQMCSNNTAKTAVDKLPTESRLRIVSPTFLSTQTIIMFAIKC